MNYNKSVPLENIQHHPIIDSHCHLSLLEKKNPQLIEELFLYSSSQEILLLDIGVVPEDLIQRHARFFQYTNQDKDHEKNQHRNIYFSVGLHPNYCQNYALEEVEKTLRKNIPNAHALGECGLDWFAQRSSKEKQLAFFRMQLALAYEYKKPLIIHARNSLDNIIKEIHNFYKEHNIQAINLQDKQQYPFGVMHCFSGTLQQLHDCLALGFYVSFTANISYTKNSYLKEVLRAVPIETLMLETDAPYLSHQSIRSKINHPKNMPLLYNTVALLRSTDIESIVKYTRANLMHFLRLS